MHGVPASQMASAADRTPHLASYPIAAKSPRTTPSPREVRIGEFSTSAYRGRTSLMIRDISDQRPLRSPSSPAPFPAAEMSWHGKPPVTISTTPRQGFPSKVRTSSQIGYGSRHPSSCRAMSIPRADASISTAHTVRHPRSLPPRMPPPAPANNASSFNVCLSGFVLEVPPLQEASCCEGRS